ncbi:hypothetical protein Tco_0618923, partial [Tanacetum coccineum]
SRIRFPYRRAGAAPCLRFLCTRNGWLEADDYLLGELEAMVDEQMVVPAIEEVVEPVAEAKEEQVITPA